MKKYSYLQSSVKISQIEARLSKNGYFSKESLPNGLDACIFKYLEQSNKIPSQKVHPNLYYWYILMRQFSNRTLELWIKKNQLEYMNDSLIGQLIKDLEFEASKENIKINAKKLNHHELINYQFFDKYEFDSHTSPNKSIRADQSKQLQIIPQKIIEKLKQRQQNLLKESRQSQLSNGGGRNESNSPSIQFEYVMDLELKPNHTTRINDFRERLQDEKMQLLQLKIIEEEQKPHDVNRKQNIARLIRIVFKIDPEDCEQIKNSISKWQEVNNLQFKKQKKIYASSIKH